MFRSVWLVDGETHSLASRSYKKKKKNKWTPGQKLDFMHFLERPNKINCVQWVNLSFKTFNSLLIQLILVVFILADWPEEVRVRFPSTPVRGKSITKYMVEGLRLHQLWKASKLWHQFPTKLPTFFCTGTVVSLHMERVDTIIFFRVLLLIGLWFFYFQSTQFKELII